MITIRQLKAALGGDIISGNQLACPGPGHSAKDRSLSVWLTDSADGFRVHSHAGDDWQECRDYVRERLGLPQWEPGDDRNRRVGVDRVRRFDQMAIDHEAAERREPTGEERQKVARAVAIWNEAGDPRGTLAEKYLNKQRMLELPDDLAGTDLRFHPRCPWRDENTGITIGVPALIVPFRSIDTDEITAVHRIALHPDGKKRDRRMLGIVRRAAVKLGVAGDTLALSEGIETGLAGRELGLGPVWALGSVGGISRFPVLPDVGTLVILAESGKASADAVSFCAPRWRAASKRVRVITPDPPHSDLNDELMAAKRRQRETAV